MRDRDRPEAHWGSSRPAGRVGAMWQKAFWSIAEAEKGFQEASWNGYLRGQGQSICRPASLAGSFWGASASIPGEKMSPLSVHWIPLVQSLSLVWLFAAPWTAARQASLSFTMFRSLLKLTLTELVMPSNHLILCHPLPLPSIFPSVRVLGMQLSPCGRARACKASSLGKSWSTLTSPASACDPAPGT